MHGALCVFLHVHACVQVRMCVHRSHFRPAHADDAVHAAAGVIEEGHGDSVLAGRQPVAFGGRVDLEDMSSGAEDGLLPSKHTAEHT